MSGAIGEEYDWECIMDVFCWPLGRCWVVVEYKRVFSARSPFHMSVITRESEVVSITRFSVSDFGVAGALLMSVWSDIFAVCVPWERRTWSMLSWNQYGMLVSIAKSFWSGNRETGIRTGCSTPWLRMVYRIWSSCCNCWMLCACSGRDSGESHTLFGVR